MRHLLGGVALAALIATAAPAWARNPANPAAGALIIPPADPAAAKSAASPPAAQAAPSAPAAVTETAIRGDRPMRHRYAWHRRHFQRRHWWRGRRSARVAEALNLEELHRVMPPHPMPPPAAAH